MNNNKPELKKQFAEALTHAQQSDEMLLTAKQTLSEAEANFQQGKIQVWNAEVQNSKAWDEVTKLGLQLTKDEITEINNAMTKKIDRTPTSR